MTYEVVVVGGGIGGLTTAALLAARGMSVCVIERQATPGGCVAAFEKFGYQFETGLGLYALWNEGEIHEQIFAELPVTPPATQPLNPAYVVRLPDHTDIVVGSDTGEFDEMLKLSFPECAAEAVRFYRQADTIATELWRAIIRVPDLNTAGRMRQLRAFWPHLLTAKRLEQLLKTSTATLLAGTSARFRAFIEAQLQLFGQCGAVECAYLYACVVLSLRKKGFFSIEGGGDALAQQLSHAITMSGGKVRLNTSALRLAYDGTGQPIGVTLLSGETITASKAIVSNLTVWDTYGKLVGLDHTPPEMRGLLKSLHSWGAYLIYAGVEEATAMRFPAEHLLTITQSGEGEVFDPAAAQINLALAPRWDPRGPSGYRAATVQVFTEAEEWFAFHEDESEHEAMDQAQLESVWQRLHRAVPELGAGIEVIDTATPQSFYANTRRKLGMVGGVGQALDVFGPHSITHRTHFPNLYLAGDTIFPGAGVAAVSHGALLIANEISGYR